jgi:hypothetical protein
VAASGFAGRVWLLDEDRFWPITELPARSDTSEVRGEK